METEKISRNRAISEGLNFYFTGKPCIYGHIAKRYISNSHCSICSEIEGVRNYEKLKAKQLLRAEQPRKYIEIGNKYGLLTVVGKSDKKSKHRRVLWDCVCECGGTRTVSSNLFYQERVTHCGCRRINRETKGQIFHKHYQNYKDQAKNRKFEFDLTIEEFENIVTQNCYYCNEPPKELNRKRSVKQKDGTTKVTHFEPQKLNGVDRVDSSLGYNKNNTVASCYPCNRMKSDLTAEDFIKHLQKIVDYCTKRLDKLV